MKILAIETSAQVASCAIVDEYKTIAEYTLDFKITHSQTIMPMIEKIISTTQTDPKEFDYIACSCGPGSFTGLRIGAATSKGLAFGWNLPIIPVPTIKALAYNIFNTDKYICPIMDARRNQVYTGIYEWKEGKIVEVLEERAITIEEIVKEALSLDKEVIFLGDGVPVHRTMLSLYDKFSFAPASCNNQRAACVGALAVEMGASTAVMGKDFRPVYLRKPQAERELEERLNGEKPMIEIIPMILEHIDDVLKVEESCFIIKWTKEDFLREINENKMAIYMVAIVDGIIVGYAGLWHVVNEGQITNVAVMPQYRRMGIGDMFMKEFFSIAENLNMIGLTLEVKISNLTAQRLYTKHGFAPEGFRKNYYKDTNEDAIIMWKYFTVNEE